MTYPFLFPYLYSKWLWRGDRLCAISQSWKVLKKMIGRMKQKLLAKVNRGRVLKSQNGKETVVLYFVDVKVFKNLSLQRLHETAKILKRTDDRLPLEGGLARLHTVKIFKALCIQLWPRNRQRSHLCRNLRALINMSAGHSVGWNYRTRHGC